MYRFQLLCQEIFERQKIGTSGTVDELLHLAEFARGRKAYAEARVYLKSPKRARQLFRGPIEIGATEKKQLAAA